MLKMTGKTLLAAALSLAVVFGVVGQAWSYPLWWTGGAATDDYSTGANWFNPAPYGVSFPPDSGSSLEIYDGTTTATVVLYSGSSTIFDFAAFANAGPGGNTSFTMKSGSSLHSTHNFDLGYYGGLETTAFNLESGAVLTVDGYFGGGRVGPHASQIQ